MDQDNLNRGRSDQLPL